VDPDNRCYSAPQGPTFKGKGGEDSTGVLTPNPPTGYASETVKKKLRSGNRNTLGVLYISYSVDDDQRNI